MIPDPFLRLVVHGRPGTAGSKSSFAIYKGTGPDRQFTGRINTAEQDVGGHKKSWRRAVTEAAIAAIRCDCPLPGCTKLRPGYPVDEAIVAAMVFTVSKPASALKKTVTYPAVMPDVGKYARATEDSLTAAGVWKDDARVVEFGRLAKVYPGEDPGSLPAPGAVILLWRRSMFGRVVPAMGLMDPGTLFEMAAS